MQHYSTGFIGREDEISQIIQQLRHENCRLLTLVGIGGAGKTRLAVHATSILKDSFFDGIYFVDLIPIRSTEEMIIALAQSIHFSFNDYQGLKEQLLQHLQNKQILFILDNFEHLLDSRTFLVELLIATPLLKLVVTSRQALQLEMEWLWNVSGLAFPPNNTAIDTYDAVKLFIERARRRNRHFILETEQDAVARICRLCTGIPLAIELAASWLNCLSPSEIAKELESSLDILSTDLQLQNERHRSIRQVIDQSWEFLSVQEQVVFARLSVFQGCFTREAAESVAGASLDVLSALVDKAIVQFHQRYSLHELLRQYAREKLLASDSYEATHTVHSHYYAHFMHTRESALTGNEQPITLNQIEADFENIRAGWLWAVEKSDLPTIGQYIAGLELYLQIRNLMREGISLFGSAANCLSSFHHELLYGQVLARLAFCHLAIYDVSTAKILFQQAIQCYPDPALRAYCLRGLAASVTFLGEPQLGKTLIEESIHFYRETGDSYRLAWAMRLGIFIRGTLGENTEGLLRENIRLQREFGTKHGLITALKNFGTYLRLIDVRASEICFREALRLSEEVKSPARYTCLLAVLSEVVYRGRHAVEEARHLAEAAFALISATHIREFEQSIAFNAIGMVALFEGDFQKAIALAEWCGTSELPTYTSDRLMLAGRANAALGNYSAAKAQLLDALHLSLQLAQPYRIAFSLVGFVGLLLQKNSLERAAEVLSLAVHHPTADRWWLDGDAYIVQLHMELKKLLSQEKMVAAWQHGKQLDLTATANTLLTEFGENRPLPQPVNQHEYHLLNLHISSANQCLPDPLTQRELEILLLLPTGITNAEIANQLGIDKGTVKIHINRILRKLDASNRGEAASRAREINLV